MVIASLVDAKLVEANLGNPPSPQVGPQADDAQVPPKSARQAVDLLPVVETFHSIQGEGQWAGTSAFFIRLAGCNVGCPWCDTKESWPMRSPLRSVQQLQQEAASARAKIIVVTGGEPLMHNLNALTAALNDISPHVHLETSGAYPLSGRFSWITLSPKRTRPPHPSLYAQADELKVVVADPADLEWAEEQAHLSPEGISKRLQPEWNTPGSNALAYQYILENPTWQMSLQTHKYVGVH